MNDDSEGNSGGTPVPTAAVYKVNSSSSTDKTSSSIKTSSSKQSMTDKHSNSNKNERIDVNMGGSTLDENTDQNNSSVNGDNNAENGDKNLASNKEIFGIGENSATSNLFLTMINLCNMIIGSGVIVLANALSQSGIFLGIILLAFSASLTDFSILALAKSGALTDKFTYQSVVNKAIGRIGVIVISVCQIIYPIFAVISYSIGIRENLSNIVEYFRPDLSSPLATVPWYYDARFLLFVITFFVILPLGSLRNISKLDKVSFCSVLLVFVYIGCVIYNVFVLPKRMFCRTGFISYGRTGFINTINIYAFALSCQHNVLPMFRSMRGLSVNKFGQATHYALIVTTSLYIVVALVGYLTFSGNASGNLLKDYCSGDTVILVARIAFSATVTLTSPLQIYSCREAISTLLFKVVDFKLYIHYILTFGIVTLCFFCSIYITALEKVISLSGSLVAAPVVFILPALSLFRLMRQGLAINNYTKFGCVVTLGFGVFVLVVGTVISIVDFIKVNPRPIQYWCNENYAMYNSTVLDSFADHTGFVRTLWGITTT